MAEYWKSTPKYWCKFCEIYVRDTGIERKNHESSAKHQGSIQRSLQKLHKGQAQQQRDAQRAKNEVARLNGVVGTQSTKIATGPTQSTPAPAPKPRPPRHDPGAVDWAAHRKAQVQQLIAMGMEVPDELMDNATGTGSWQTVSERVIDDEPAPHLKDDPAARVQGVHKRKVDDGEDEDDEPAARKRKAWGSSLKSYPGRAAPEDDGDLDALLTGISKKQTTTSATQEAQSTESGNVKQEVVGSISTTDDPELKQEGESAVTAPPVITFKKRKAKR